MQEVIGKNAWAAGIVANNKGNISNCYNIGKAINGLVGNNEGNIQYCYYLSGSSSKMQISGNIGTYEDCSDKTEEELQSKEFLIILNTGNTETMFIQDTNYINNGYPVLKWQLEE